MKPTFFKIFFDYCIYALSILLAFLLIFERYLDFPLLVHWLGHWHPLVLHFPIVLVLVTVVQYWRKDLNLSWYLSVTSLLTLISAITGFILSMEGDAKGNLILTHQWMGVAVSCLMVIWYFSQQSISRTQVKILQGALVLLIVLTGHFGGMVTHGQDFLSFNNTDESEFSSLPENPNIYIHIVQPVLDKKCVSCHNENKSKGELILSDFSQMQKGGKSGSILDQQQGIFSRINLPLDHEDHMPPADEKQLTNDEIVILKTWLEEGASDELMYNDLAAGTDLHSLIDQLIERSNSNLWIDLPDISDEDIVEYASDYCTIQRIYNGSNALQVIIFAHETFSTDELKELSSISENIVDLNLSNLPLDEKDMKIVNSFENLEKLDLSGSTISNAGLSALKSADKLTTLKIYNTEIDDESIGDLRAFPVLSNLYIYSTKITDAGVQKLGENSSLNIVGLSEVAEEFKSILPPPLVDPIAHFYRRPFYVKLNHPLNNIDIKYTIDGTNPDENSTIIGDSLYVDENFNLKYFAAKDGWESSSIDSIQFLKSIYMPEKYELLHPPDQKYLGVGKSLLFDLEKGSANFGDDAWMAFKDNPFSLTCEFDTEVQINIVTLSSMVNTDPYLFPPSKISVYGGTNSTNLRLIGSVSPKDLRERTEQHFEFYQVAIDSIPLKVVKIVVTPLKKIPMWHRGKGEPGWFFIDELVFSSN